MDLNDTDTLIRLLDRAMSSNNETVREMLQSLLVTVSLIHADDKLAKGPLDQLLTGMREMQEDVKYMQRKMDELEKELHRSRSASVTRPRPYTSIYDNDDDFGGWRKRDHEDDNAWGDSIKRILGKFQSDRQTKSDSLKKALAKRQLGKKPIK